MPEKAMPLSLRFIQNDKKHINPQIILDNTSKMCGEALEYELIFKGNAQHVHTNHPKEKNCYPSSAPWGDTQNASPKDQAGILHVIGRCHLKADFLTTFYERKEHCKEPIQIFPVKSERPLDVCVCSATAKVTSSGGGRNFPPLHRVFAAAKDVSGLPLLHVRFIKAFLHKGG